MFSALRRRFQVRFPADALYRAVVVKAREPGWFTAGAVPDSVDGRFDMVALMFALAHRALERGGAEPALLVALTERFVDDMDSTLREMGIGDMVMGKHVGRMVGALGGRLGAYREALDGGEDLRAALVRNLYRGVEPSPAALDWAERETRAVAAALDATPLADLAEGRLP